jgi:4-hydroxy-tetrahydrodipicolinate synthase
VSSGKSSFSGIIPAVITPFNGKKETDHEGLEIILRGLVEHGVSGFLINGSTGEAATLSREERIENIQSAGRVARGHAKVLAGVGSPSTAQAIQFAKDARDAGADALIALTPYDIIPNKEGLLEYYKEIAKSVDVPVIAYNLPQHTGVNLGVDTLVELANGNVVAGIKESSGNLANVAQMIDEVGGKISILTGSDDLTLQSFVMGCSGAILALGNLAPKLCVDIFESVQKGDYENAKKLYYRVLPLAQAIGSPENFPAPIKEALRMLEKPAGPCRSPVVPVSAAEKERVRKALEHAGLM